jgi:hypothetical protein
MHIIRVCGKEVLAGRQSLVLVPVATTDTPSSNVHCHCQHLPHDVVCAVCGRLLSDSSFSKDPVPLLARAQPLARLARHWLYQTCIDQTGDNCSSIVQIQICLLG